MFDKFEVWGEHKNMLTSVVQLKSARDWRAQKFHCSVFKRIEQVHLNFRELKWTKWKNLGFQSISSESNGNKRLIFHGDRCHEETTLMTHSFILQVDEFICVIHQENRLSVVTLVKLAVDQ